MHLPARNLATIKLTHCLGLARSLLSSAEPSLGPKRNSSVAG